MVPPLQVRKISLKVTWAKAKNMRGINVKPDGLTL